jgi:uncharacterized membrane protein YqjE
MVVEKTMSQQPTIGSLLKSLINEISNLLRQHIELFRYEIKKDVETATKYTGIAVIGALVAYTSLIFLGFFIIFTLALIMPLWLASLLVTVLYFILALITIFVARNHLKKLRKEPEATKFETKKTAEEAKKWLHNLK